MAPITPADGVRTKKATKKLEDKEAERVAILRTPDITRFIRREQMRKLARLQNGPLQGTNPALHQAKVKVEDVNRTNTGCQPQMVPPLQHEATSAHPQFNISNALPEATSHAPMREIAEHAGVQKILHQYQSKAKRQALEQRDIYEFPHDSEDDATFEEPSTSSFRYPPDESTPASLESETLEQYIRREIHNKAALDKEVQLESISTLQVDANLSRSEEEGGLDTGAQDEHLDDLDIEILNLGCEPDGESTHGPPIASSSSPKRPRTSAHSESSDYNQFQAHNTDNESENDEDFRASSPKKRRRSTSKKPLKAAHDAAFHAFSTRRKSKTAPVARQEKRAPKQPRKQPQKQKKPRRPPVDELVLGSQRLDSDFDEQNSLPLELSQDFISQISDRESIDVGLHTKVSVRIRFKVRSRKGIGLIDASEFRIPKPQSPRSRPTLLRTPSHSDGFEGKEAEPIGRVMPVKGSSRRNEGVQKITVRLSKLTLVAERPSSPLDSNRRPTRRKKKRRPDIQPQSQQQTEVIQPSIEQGDQMQVDDQPELNDDSDSYGAGPSLPNPETPRPDSGDERASQNDASTRSPLKRKRQIKISDRREANKSAPKLKAPGNAASAEKSQAVSLPHTQSANIERSPKKTPRRARDELQALQEMSQVTIRTRQMSSDDEDDNEVEEASEDGEADEDEDRLRRSDSQRSNTDESYEDPDDEGETDSDGSGSELTPEQESGADIKLEMPVCGHSLGEDGVGQDEPQHLQEGQSDAETSSEAPEVPAASLQKLAKQAPEFSQHLSSDLPALFRDDILRTDNRHLDVSRGYISQRHTSLKSARYDDHLDSSWRPQAPSSGGIAMEVDEEIHDSPEPAATRAKARSQIDLSRRRSRAASQPLYLVHSRPHSPISQEAPPYLLGSQESAILGETQNFVLPEVSIPETQFSNELEAPRFRGFEAPSYISQVSQNLKGPARKYHLAKTKSTPAHVHFVQEEASQTLVSLSAIFRNTISPEKSGPRLPTLLEESPKASEILSALTRRASSGIGTMPAKARKRMISAPWVPPFKEAQGEVENAVA